MKILHVTKKYPNALGGDAVVVANLQQQQAARHEVAVVTSNCDEITGSPSVYKLGLKDTPAGLDAITVRRIASLVIIFFRMFSILRKERPDVIHTHSIDMAFVVSFAARLFRIPIVHTFHIVTFYGASQSVLRQKTELWLAKKTNPRVVTAPNHYDVEMLKTAGLPQTTLLPNGVDLAFWEPRPTGQKKGPFTFLAVGRLEAQKGYTYLIKAAALLAKRQSRPFRVVVVGEGSQARWLQALANDLQLKDTVAFVGRKSPEETRALLRSAQAVVCPSLYETTPLTLLEAWAAAVPVIVTPVGILRGTPATFNSAIVVPPQDEQALMQAMKQCITDKTLASAIAANGHEEVKRYAWPSVNQTAEALYWDTQ